LLITTAGLAVALVSTAGCTPQERPAETQTVVAAAEAAEVVAVVDGDTIDVKTSAGESRVRIIGIVRLRSDATAQRGTATRSRLATS